MFKDCEIRCNRKKGYITAPSTPQGNKYGFVFLNCDITANEDCDSCWLSRPWRDYGRTVFIECNIGGHIRPEGWNNWRKPHREQTCYYAEYGNTGPEPIHPSELSAMCCNRPRDIPPPRYSTTGNPPAHTSDYHSLYQYNNISAILVRIALMLLYFEYLSVGDYEA